MLEAIELMYNVVENLEEKGFVIERLEILGTEITIVHTRDGIRLTSKFNLSDLNILEKEG